MDAPVSSKKNEKDWTPDPGRRRSLRVLLSVPVLVSGKTVDNTDFHEETRTLVVNAHGALIALAAKVAAGQQVTVSSKTTRQSLECRIVYLGNSSGGKTQLAVEFVQASPSFWQIDFPPEDWVTPEN
jgi:hypothetical protein